jgi:uncharacterized membrane protein YbhN (UPF0104 family)
MDWKARAKNVVKLVLTFAIFIGIFAEFGGGRVAVSREGLENGSIWLQANPAMPGLVGRVKAKVSGKALPEPYAPLAVTDVCRVGATGAVFAKDQQGQVFKVKALRHCAGEELKTAYAGPEGEQQAIDTIQGSSVWLVKQGFQLVPMDMSDLMREINLLDPSVFLPWFAVAMLVKLVGIFANVYRWQVLLAGQGLEFGFGWLTSSYFVGRYWGIVTPGTLGLDGWRWYDTYRNTKKPVECATALAVERVIGLVGLLAVILMFMPFANLQGRDLADVVSALAVPFAAALVFGLLLLLRPSAISGLAGRIPHAKARAFLQSAIESATAYSSRRGTLVVALACAVFGQVTTMLMYFANAMALQVEGVTAAQVLYASAVMTLGTFLAPSASGEGVRELVFVYLLGGKTTAVKAFLIGHLGFWIEKLPLSIPGGIILLRNKEAYSVTQEELKAARQEAAAAKSKVEPSPRAS